MGLKGGKGIERAVTRARRRLSTKKATRRVPDESYWIVNISPTGALLATEERFPKGTELELELDLGQSVRVAAEVVREQKHENGLIGGLGVKFLDLNAESEGIIREYVNAEDADYCDDLPPGSRIDG